MGVVILPKSHQATPSATVSNIDGTGTLWVASGGLDIPFSGLSMAEMPILEVRFTHQLTGGTGLCRTRVTIEYMARHLDNGLDLPPRFSFGYVTAGATARSRIVRFSLPILHTDAAQAVPDVLRTIVRATGSGETSEWAVTDISARLIYLPL